MVQDSFIAFPVFLSFIIRNFFSIDFLSQFKSESKQKKCWLCSRRPWRTAPMHCRALTPIRLRTPWKKDIWRVNSFPKTRTPSRLTSDRRECSLTLSITPIILFTGQIQVLISLLRYVIWSSGIVLMLTKCSWFWFRFCCILQSDRSDLRDWTIVCCFT